jgi:hypothetical protein
MRTTLELDDDIFEAAKETAAVRRTTAGKVLSQLPRKVLTPPPAVATVRNGVPLLPPRPEGSRILTMKCVNVS